MNFTELTPLRGRFIASFEVESNTTASGLYKGIEEKRKHEAVVLAIGEPVLTAAGDWRTADFKVGDRVILNPSWASHTYEYRNESGDERSVGIFNFSDPVAIVNLA